jgi:hypothetical protein
MKDHVNFSTVNTCCLWFPHNTLLPPSPLCPPEGEVENVRVGDHCELQIILIKTKFSLLWYINERFVVEWN